MEALFEFIFSNPIFAFLLIGGIISFFNRQTKEQNEQQSAGTGTSQTQKHQQTTQRRQNQRENDRRPQPHRHSYEEDESLTFDERRAEQLENLADRIDTSLNPEEEVKQEMKDVSKKALETVQTASKKDKKAVDESFMQQRLQKRLTRDGLIDSIVMAEVLGRPRAFDRYSNVLTRREIK